MTTAPPRVLTVAGSDSGGGAGIQADLKTMLALGVHGMSVVTAVTAQNSTGVHGYWELPTAAIDAQLAAVLDDIGVDAVKTGMLASPEIVETTAKRLAGQAAPVVVDPVCVSKHGDDLLVPAAVDAIIGVLLPLATVVTPNLAEVARLTGIVVEDAAGQRRAADALLALGPRWALVKGGHLPGDAVDLLTDGDVVLELSAPRLDNAHTHGTGCTLASAIASYLALGENVRDAVRGAKFYVTGAIAAGFPLGAGIGPVDHGWAQRPHRSRTAALPAAPPGWEVRDEPLDSPAAHQLVTAVQAEYVERYGGGDSGPIDPSEFRAPDGAFVVGYLDGVPVATGGLRPHAPGEAEVKRMYVAPGARGRGLSRLLLAALEGRARAQGLRRLVLETGTGQPEAISLYQSSGYVRIEPYGHYRNSPMSMSFAKHL